MVSSPLLPHFRRATTADQIAANLREGMARGVWDRLLPSERELARYFGVSRPSIHAALLELARAGLVENNGRRPIRIVSGYRTRSFYQDSRHKLSRAVDFSIPGIDNTVVRDYLRTLPAAGVGYYPNSSFVHLDVRDTATYWVDYAGPGEAPRKTLGHDDHEHDQEAEGDLQDPEVSEGDRPAPSEPATLDAATAPAAGDLPGALAPGRSPPTGK